MNEPFELSSGEKSHPLWARLRAHLVERLADARQRNDQVVPESETAKTRGAIACLKAIIALGDDKPVVDRF